MTVPAPRAPETWSERLRQRLGERALAVLLSLAIEALLVLAILSLGMIGEQKQPGAKGSLVSVSFDAAEPAAKPAKPAAAKVAASQPQPAPQLTAPGAQAPVEKVPVPVVTPSAAPRPFVQLAGPAVNIGSLPRQPAAATPAKQAFGPASPGSAGDSKRVGTAPNGQPMYAAAWYREPYDNELAGYLSTADGPGWALIACRTAPEWRVEDCVALDEYPNGSNIARSVLAAAWQFQVRPPRLGGVYKVGEWVRIRIDYGVRRRS